MIRALLILLFLVAPAVAEERTADFIYRGKWFDTNYGISETMTATVYRDEDKLWHARFQGIWQGRPFDHRVEFKDPRSKIDQRVRLDRIDYHWKGALTDKTFRANFTSRQRSYKGHFELTRVR